MQYSREEYKISLRLACDTLMLSTSVYYYESKPKDADQIIVDQLAELADLHQRWGFWMMHYRLRKLGFTWNHKRVYRIYTHMRLNLRNKRKKRLPARVKEPLLRPIHPNVCWSIDFMHDTLACGKVVRTLNIMDDFNREVLSVAIDSSLPSKRVIRELDQLVQWRGKPDKIRVDNGPEFIAEVLKNWCQEKHIELGHIQPGKPTQNSLIERFNRTFREEVLDSYSFESIKQMKTYAYAWMWVYNNDRPHSALGYLTPKEFLLKYGKLEKEFPTFQQDDGECWKSLILSVAM